jgi:2-oxoisovalerate dehydrogenase E1 component alpha subunit
MSLTIDTSCYLDSEGALAADTPPIEDAILIRGYKIMALTRYVEAQLIILQRQGTISFTLTSLGEEACIVASAAALEPSDWIYPQYREVGAFFWRGASIQEFVNQMFGNSSDLCHGRQMPIHFGNRALNVVTASSPIGSKIPHAAGCGYAMKFLNEPSVSICYFGEGATSSGDFHAGLNFAAVKKVPTIFFCRNNCYAISTPASQQFASEGVAPKGIGYGIEAMRVDGNDFFAVYHAVKAARQRGLSGLGPTLIEAMTYRMGGHSTSDDPTAYRDEVELHAWQAKDPLIRLKKHLIGQGLWSDELDNNWHQQVQREITAAVEKAKATPPPPLETIVKDVYFEMPHTLHTQFDELQELFGQNPSGAS